jgi:LysM repeat protein
MTVLATVAKAPVDGAEAPAKAIVSAAGKREARQGGVPVLTATKKQSAATAPAVATATRQAGTTPASQRVAKKQPAAPALVVAAGKKQAAVAVAAVTIPKAKKAAQTWYVVKNGDTLWNIAKRFQISPQEIKKLNNLPNNNLARGDKLLVKRG